MIGYPSERLREEVAYIARQLHWSLEEILNLDHIERRRWIAVATRMDPDAVDGRSSGRPRWGDMT